MKAVELYEKGVLTTIEFEFHVFEWLSMETLEEFLLGCPADAVLQLQRSVDDLPADADDAGWTRFRIYWAGYPDPRLTAEELEQIEQERHRCFREGVRLFRAATN